MTTETKMNSPSSKAACDQGKPSGLVCNYPISSALVVFGIGIGAGVALGSLLCGPSSSRMTLGPRTAMAAEHLGRQIQDAITGVLPASLAKYIAV